MIFFYKCQIMKILKLLENNYYLNSSISFFKTNSEKRIKFINKKKFLFCEISSFINNCIDQSKNTLIFCAGNSLISNNIKSNKIFIKEISDEYKIKYNKNALYINEINEKDLKDCDTVVISDIEHQLNPTSNLLKLSKLINDDAKIVIISKNIFWMILIKIFKYFFKFSPTKNNFLPSSYLKIFFLVVIQKL